MATRSRNLLSALLLVALLAGCKGQPETAQKKVTYPDTSPPRQPFPKIVSVDPDTVSASNGSAWIGLLRVHYTIPTPEKVQKAELQIYNPVTRVVARTPVPIQAEGTLEWNVAASASLGPSVRLRADCPSGFSEWVPLGLYQYPASTAQVYINNVTPKYIREPYSFDPDNARTPSVANLEVWGVGFQPPCKVQASVNNAPPQELSSVYAGPNHLMAQLPWVGEVGTRDLELKLILRGQGFATEDIFHVRVADE
jgi:hypothetical protein